MDRNKQRKGGMVPRGVPKLCEGEVSVSFAAGPPELDAEDVLNKCG